ncbi:hypothetical protein AAFF_G00432400 [Aldrovandia affinis]|uniref:Uncharacterized protein n=1 Tax=Aldrovandia affinis TaxID=143900 RepID=A0AAD7S8S7_9TELE|nr:hypothetical protein AAFF_G00432400 [Aldrovandia affinis]
MSVSPNPCRTQANLRRDLPPPRPTPLSLRLTSLPSPLGCHPPPLEPPAATRFRSQLAARFHGPSRAGVCFTGTQRERGCYAPNAPASTDTGLHRGLARHFPRHALLLPSLSARRYETDVVHLGQTRETRSFARDVVAVEDGHVSSKFIS